MYLLSWLIENVTFAHVFVSGWGSATYCGRTKEDPWGTHEARSGEARNNRKRNRGWYWGRASPDLVSPSLSKQQSDFYSPSLLFSSLPSLLFSSLLFLFSFLFSSLLFSSLLFSSLLFSLDVCFMLKWIRVSKRGLLCALCPHKLLFIDPGKRKTFETLTLHNRTCRHHHRLEISCHLLLFQCVVLIFDTVRWMHLQKHRHFPPFNGKQIRMNKCKYECVCVWLVGQYISVVWELCWYKLSLTTVLAFKA